jgi:hypothetical protein
MLMFAWLTNLLGTGIFQIFGSAILGPILQAWANKQNVDLEKFKTAAGSSEALAVQVLQANENYQTQKIAYATSLLSWWPFRILLLILMLPPAVHFAAIMVDSTFPFHWGIAKVPPPYDSYEREFVLFFIVAKPVDSLITSVGVAMTAWLRRPDAIRSGG